MQLFWLHLQMTWKIRAAVPAFLTDSAWSGTLEPDGTLIGMTIDTRRGHLLEMSRSQLVIYDLQTGKRLRTLQPDWIGQVAYHPDDVLIVSGSERTWVVSAETFEILHEHPWGGWVSKDGSKVITQEHEQGVHDAISGQVLCTLPFDPQVIRCVDFSEDGRYGLQAVSRDAGKTWLSQIVDLSDGTVKTTLPVFIHPERKDQNGPCVLSHDAENHVLAVGYRNHMLQILDTRSWNPMHVLDLYGEAEGYVGLHLRDGVLHYLTPNHLGRFDLSTGEHQQTSCQSHGFEKFLYHLGMWVLQTYTMCSALTGSKILWEHQNQRDLPAEECTLHLKVSRPESFFSGHLRWQGQSFAVSGTLEAQHHPLMRQQRTSIRLQGVLKAEDGTLWGRLSLNVHPPQKEQSHPALSCSIWQDQKWCSGIFVPLNL
ncbi:hypothetical protein DC3_54460 [Deinococcus cellulosilyticus NBRC 106333 = KACC 11606]|uniref:Uncharacterized protein n=1 Tax=Deinococcus cellulosilyticus (strain DSM 18568 / NBRC 106333 / KACC 11606 / 5516J-15) TaxID=1223518 RepID=A0A511NBR8_DEIC1|nr:hypothetical protein DC3_54460 [Deinococcus cellulosilyticus NBRC 106333 = KACC 11606]